MVDRLTPLRGADRERSGKLEHERVDGNDSSNHRAVEDSGYPGDMSPGRIRCEVRTSKKVLFESPQLDSSRRAAVFKVNTEGARELTLVVRSLKGSIDYAHGVCVDLNVSD